MSQISQFSRVAENQNDVFDMFRADSSRSVVFEGRSYHSWRAFMKCQGKNIWGVRLCDTPKAQAVRARRERERAAA